MPVVANAFASGTGREKCRIDASAEFLAARIDARNDYQASEANYKVCLTANPSSPQTCEGLRLAMEADERKYNNLSAGLHPGSQGAATLTILNR